MKSRLAISLGWVAGYTNVVSVLLLGVTTSHATGNVTHFGQMLAQRNMSNLEFYAGLLLSFIFGAASSGLMMEGARLRGMRSKYILPLAVEAALLAMFSLGVTSWFGGAAISTPKLYAMSMIAAFAMGLQNATVTSISGAVVRTTHLTGVLTDLGLEGMQLILWYWDRWRAGGHNRTLRLIKIARRHPTAQRVALLASIVGSFLFGACAGTLMYLHWPGLGLVPPTVFLVVIIVIGLRRPIADVRELDLLSDPELKMLGIVKSLLPPEVAVFRVAHDADHGEHHSPNFERWLDRIPRSARVIVLALTPFTRFDSNSALAFFDSVQKLYGEHRRVVLAGVRAVHYKSLDRHGLTELLDTADLCPDLEFAIARALELARQVNEGTHPLPTARAISLAREAF
jgi:uncharacterized membrane protein YoaK (UPF0700 family)